MEVHSVFPFESYMALMECVSQVQQTSFHPQHLINSMKATLRILDIGASASQSDQEMVRKFIHEVLPGSYDKCIRDEGYLRAARGIQAQLLEAILLLNAVVARALVILGTMTDACYLEKDCSQLVLTLSWAFDARSTLHAWNVLDSADQQVPEYLKATIPEWNTSEVSLHTNEGADEAKGDGEDARRTPINFIIHTFQLMDGFTHALYALDEAPKYSLVFIEDLLQLLKMAVDKVDLRVYDAFRQISVRLLAHLQEVVREDHDKLSDYGADRTYQHFSAIIQNVFLILNECAGGVSDANEVVTPVQREFVHTMLNSSHFNKLLSGVRECSRMLVRARDIADLDQGAAIKSNVQWLDDQMVVKRMLRGNLHQRQYVEQVLSILTVLTEQDSLREEHLELLWSLTEQEETYDVVKTNVFQILAELAVLFSQEQLNLLFKKFEVIKGRSLADTIRMLELLKRLALSDSDTGGALMAQKLLDLIWDITMPADAPPELLQCNAIQDVIKEYESRGHGFIHVYLVRCLEQISQGHNAYTSLHVLKALIGLFPVENKKCPNYSRSSVIQDLDKRYSVMKVLTEQLKALVGRAHHVREQGGPHAPLPSEGCWSYHQIVEEYLRVLKFLGQNHQYYFDLDLAVDLWFTLITNPVTEEEQVLCLNWMKQAVMDPEAFLDEYTMKDLLDMHITKLDTRSLSMYAWNCFFKFFQQVNNQKLRVGQKTLLAHDLDLVGLAFLWRVYLDCAHGDVAQHARTILSQLYLCQGKSEQAAAPNRHEFIDRCYQYLVKAVNSSQQAVTQEAGLTGAWTTITQVERVLWLLSAAIHVTNGPTMPPVPAHKNSWKGTPLGVDVQALSSQRFRILSHTTQYVGSLRASIALRLGVAPNCVRLLWQGKELLNDALTIEDEDIRTRVVMSCTTSPQGNSFTRSKKDYMEEWERFSFSAHLSRLDRVYDILMDLADCVVSQEVNKHATTVLTYLPTWDSSILSIKQALKDPSAPDMLRNVLVGSPDKGLPPYKILYMLQCLCALLFPNELEYDPSAFDSPDHYMRWQVSFLSSDSVQVVFEAIDRAAAQKLEQKGNSYPFLCELSTLLLLLLAGLLTCAEEGMPSQLFSSQGAAGKTSGISDDGRDSVDEVTSLAQPLITPSSGSVLSDTGLGQADDVAETKNMEEEEEEETNSAGAGPGPRAGAGPGADLNSVDNCPEEAMAAADLDVCDESGAAPGVVAAADSAGVSPSACPAQGVSAEGAPDDSAPDTPSSLPPPSPTLEVAVLKLMGRRLVMLAWQMGRRWGLQCGSVCRDFEAPSEGPLVKEAFHLLTKVLQLHDSLREELLSQEDTGMMFAELLLHPSHQTIRELTEDVLRTICVVEGEPSSHLWLVRLLLQIRPKLVSEGHPCREYYRLFQGAIAQLAEKALPEAFSLADQLLQEEIKALQQPEAAKVLPTAEDSNELLDEALEGRLGLVLALVRVLDRRSVGSDQEGGLIRRLLTGHLFPEALVMSQAVKGALDLVKERAQVSRALQPPCRTPSCRKAALTLVSELVTDNLTNLEQGVSLLCELHYDYRLLPAAWDQQGPPQSTSTTPYRGLKNAGATCYMNAVLQQLYMQPHIRRLVLSAKDVTSPEERPDNVFFQTQTLFSNLLLSKASYYIPRCFWQSFKDYDGQPVDVREHQDAYEFFTRLQDSIDQHMRNSHQVPALQAVIGGKFAQQIICRDVDYRSEREEEFCQISVDVRGKTSLEKSLESYVRGELMEGDNAYFCEEFGKRVAAVKRACIKELPGTLVVHLKRFEFDYHSQTRYKVRDRFEFPQHLDMFPYTADGLAAMERVAGDVSPSSKPRSHYLYDLKGIVVHSGSAFTGHYYSYIKERDVVNTDGTVQAGRWYCFDDKTVEPWDINMLEDDCFGGRLGPEAIGPLGKVGVRQECDRPHSAYMLFYDRQDLPLDKICDGQYLGGLNSAPEEDAPKRATSHESSPSPLPSTDVGPAQRLKLDNDVMMASPSSTPKLSQTSCSGNLEAGAGSALVCGYDMPAHLYRQVLEDNLRYVYCSHVLDKDYFRFIRGIVEAKWDHQLLNRKARRTDPSLGSTSTGKMQNMSLEEASPSQPSPPSRRTEDSEGAVYQSIRLATLFFFELYVHAHPSLRTDVQAWQEVLASLLTTSVVAVHGFLVLINQHPSWLEANLIHCPNPPTRELVQWLISLVLREASKQANMALVGQVGPVHAESDLLLSTTNAIALLVDHLLKLVKLSAQEPGLECNEVVKLLMDYALQDASHKVHLLHTQCVLWAAELAIVCYHQSQQGEPTWLADCALALNLISVLVVGAPNIHVLVGEATGMQDVQPYPLTSSMNASSPAVALPQRVYRSLMTHKLVGLLPHPTLLAQPGVFDLLNILMWEHRMASELVVDVILDCLVVMTMQLKEFKTYLARVLELLLCPDSLKDERMRWLALGTHRPHPSSPLPLSLVTLPLCFQRNSFTRTLYVLTYLVKLADMDEDLEERVENQMKHYVEDWKQVLEGILYSHFNQHPQQKTEYYPVVKRVLMWLDLED